MLQAQPTALPPPALRLRHPHRPLASRSALMEPVELESLARGQSLEIAARLTAFAVVPTTTAVMGARLDSGHVVPAQGHPLPSQLRGGRSPSR